MHLPQSNQANPTGNLNIAHLALQLHIEKGAELRVDIPVDWLVAEADLPRGCKLVDGAIEFNSLADRNKVVAQAVFLEFKMISGVDISTLFERAYQLWRNEIGHDDQASGRLLALASEHVDVFAAGSQRIMDGSDVFDVMHLLCAALPYLLNLEAQSIINLIVAKYEPTKNDLARGIINNALEVWLESRPNDAKDLHQIVLDNLTSATEALLGNAVLALSKSDYAAAVDIATEDARSENPLRAAVGIRTLGQLLLDNCAPPVSIKFVVETIIELIGCKQDEVRSQAIRAAVGAMHALSDFDSTLLRLAEIGDQSVLSSVATALFLNNKEIQIRGNTKLWLEHLTALKPDLRGAIKNLDSAMAQMLAEPANTGIVISTLSQWIANHGRRIAIDTDTIALFDDSFDTLFASETHRNFLITDWLLSEKQEHAAALAGVLSRFSHQEFTKLELDKSRLDKLMEVDFLFLARRMMGYVHDRAQLTSLALSMLESREPDLRIYPVLYTLLVDEIGYDYPGSTVEACRQAATSSVRDKSFLLGVADAIDKLVSIQNDLPSLNELRPPIGLRRLFARARAKQMEESFEEASKDSVWRQIATEIPIKAGSGTFSYQDANYGPAMMLSTMSHSIELPRSEVFDPVGNSIRHLGFRLAVRDED